MSCRFGSKSRDGNGRRQQQIKALHELPHLGAQKASAKIERMQIGRCDSAAQFSLCLKIRIGLCLLRTTQAVINLAGSGKPKTRRDLQRILKTRIDCID